MTQIRTKKTSLLSSWGGFLSLSVIIAMIAWMIWFFHKGQQTETFVPNRRENFESLELVKETRKYIHVEYSKVKYISTKGIINSCDVYIPFLNMDAPNKEHPLLKEIFDGIQWFDNIVIFVTSCQLEYFFPLSKTIPVKFILVTGDKDNTVPDDLKFNYRDFVNNEKLVHWFCCNLNFQPQPNHPKITPIPLGIDYHKESERSPQNDKITQPIQQEKILEEIKSKHKGAKKKVKCYANFHFAMDSRYGYDREEALAKIPKNVVYYEPTRAPRKKCWEKQVEYYFVISPLGNGLDCHRTWESLALGNYVIVKTGPLDPLYKDLPVLIVKDWGDVNQTLLQKTVDEFRNKSFKMEKITMKYWDDVIHSYRD